MRNAMDGDEGESSRFFFLYPDKTQDDDTGWQHRQQRSHHHAY